ncbi:MAG: glutathione peroxidase [Balneolales bacterium]|nr:glutathione peroxidase [Balneolales bacterium]
MAAEINNSETTSNSVFDYSFNTLNGEQKQLSEFKGNVVLIVNTASKCGFTRQYAELQELYERYSEKGFVVLGFPSADFGGQEFGTDEEIAEFCERNYGVSFPMFSKISVKGENQHPLFEMLTSAENPDYSGDINWNFEKFLLDKEGNLIRRFRSRTTPLSTEMTSSIEALIES